MKNIFLREYCNVVWYLYRVKKRIKYFSGTTRVDSWKSSGVREGNIKSIIKSESNFALTLLIIIYFQT